MKKLKTGDIVVIDRIFGYRPVPEAWGVLRECGHVACAPTRSIAREMRAVGDMICRIVGSDMLKIKVQITR